MFSKINWLARLKLAERVVRIHLGLPFGIHFYFHGLVNFIWVGILVILGEIISIRSPDCFVDVRELGDSFILVFFFFFSTEFQQIFQFFSPLLGLLIDQDLLGCPLQFFLLLEVFLVNFLCVLINLFLFLNLLLALPNLSLEVSDLILSHEFNEQGNIVHLLDSHEEIGVLAGCLCRFKFVRFLQRLDRIHVLVRSGHCL